MNRRIGQIALLAFFGFVLGTATAWHQESGELRTGASLANIEPAAGTSLIGAEIGGAFSLVDHNGRSVTEKNYADAYKLVFFGFTYCPEICPTELKKMAVTLHQIGDLGDAIQPIFITIDPERDTPEVLSEYVEMFHPRLIGLTGTAENIKNVQDSYKVYASKVNDPSLSDYTMEHSSYMFLMGPGDEPLALFTTEDTPAQIAKDIKKILGGA